MKNWTKILPVGVALAIGLTGCGAGEPPVAQAEVSESTASSAASSPSDLPTSSPKSTPIPPESTEPSTQGGGSTSEYSAADLKALSLEQFNELPLDDRLVLVDDMLRYAKEWQSGEFGEHWEKAKMTDLYKYSPLDVASPDNSLEEIVMQNLYMNQLALTQTEDMAMSGTFDPDTAAKTLSGLSISSEFPNSKANDTIADSVQYQGLVRNIATVGEFRAEYPQEIASIDERLSSLEAITDEDGKKHPGATVVYYLDFKEDVGVAFPKGGHVKFSEKYVYHTYETPSGDKQGLWLAYESTSFGRVK
ncbi:hypothetical protein KRR55_06020 [Paeniglutamicibacter sp. ABSL32-1]|uniref:hypothetical protein n=1 Tax=Paeniglutamicibacter quisquiliarum TaxID=2849498 RepID=UPI001C2D306E|nr:hypothetical protein [Paeniglutamicibacter quisquiliarum]MBV1778668.1 hypothetical protein [Paeniglutamicibacter quisquiliarum]